MEFLRQQQQNTSVTVPDNRADAPINQLGNDRTLASASNEAFVGPNLDTLYTFAHVDLSKGPLVLHVPAVSSRRYYSFEFLDPYTNVSITSARARRATAPAILPSSVRRPTPGSPPGCSGSRRPTSTSGSSVALRSTATRPPTSRRCTRSRTATS
jgi:hypothetical protein